MYNFSNNGSETENSGIKTSTLAREHVSTQGTLAREHAFSTQGTQFSRLKKKTLLIKKTCIIKTSFIETSATCNIDNFCLKSKTNREKTNKKNT